MYIVQNWFRRPTVEIYRGGKLGSAWIVLDKQERDTVSLSVSKEHAKPFLQDLICKAQALLSELDSEVQEGEDSKQEVPADEPGT